MKITKTQIFSLVLAWFSLHPLVQAQEAEELYTTRCAVCHEMPAVDPDRPPPSRSDLADMSANTIYRAIMEGAMRLQGAGLTNEQMRGVAEFLTGESVIDVGLIITTNMCPVNPPMRNPVLSAQWNGCG